MFVELIGYVAGIFTLLNMLPQIVKTYKLKKVDELSFLLIITYAISMLLWVVYAYFIVSWPIIITNGLSLILSIFQLGLMFKYKK
ncbi:MAG TPA: hypothetical protein DEB09_03610 [Candidatus Magasanikbacteria bacterium]|nr:hypothetical protein [Candidatus Magasanikbacteria bacterium]